MRIGVPKETQDGERRVAATPETVKRLVDQGFSVCVQRGAGEAAFIQDEDYLASGAEVAESFRETVAGSRLVLKVQAPNAQEIRWIEPGTAVVAMFSPFENPWLRQYLERGLACFAMELIPRISRAQSMDVLSSQANVAGYKAVLLACEHYPKFFPMLMTAAGTIQPARVLVLGAGVAGLQAIATARRLGAMVEAFDVRAATREQVESLGAKFIALEGVDAEDERGYARELSEEEKKMLEELVAERAANADVIITTAQVPGKRAPELIKPEVVERMRPGSVIVDLAAASGGNCRLTQANRVVVHRGVTIVGKTNLPSLLAADASRLYARNVLQFIGLILRKEEDTLALDSEDEIVKSTLLCKDGRWMNDRVVPEGAMAGGV